MFKLVMEQLLSSDIRVRANGSFFWYIKHVPKTRGQMQTKLLLQSYWQMQCYLQRN